MEKEEKKSEQEIDEISDEIEGALKDSRGVNAHQKRLAFCLSLGITNLLENYLKKKQVLKHGYKIDHRILKKKKENAMKILSGKLTSLENLDKLDKIIKIAYEIENKRDNLAYGAKVSEDILREIIKKFMDIKKEVEND